VTEKLTFAAFLTTLPAAIDIRSQGTELLINNKFGNMWREEAEKLV
jgi:hypothetical protein